MNIEDLCKLTDELFDNGGPLDDHDLNANDLRATASSNWMQKYPDKVAKLNEQADKLEANGVLFFLEKLWGGEDQGSSYGIVWKVAHKGETHLIMKTAYYASHYGTDDWQDARVAVPTEVTTTVYE